jgi:hypothetical protein
MKYIKTYEGLFDFFKKVDEEKLAKECRRILSSHKDLKETKLMDGFEWSFSDIVEGFDLIFLIKLTKRDSGTFYLHIKCEVEGQEEATDYIAFMKDGKEMLQDLEFHINHNVKSLSRKVSTWMKSEEFFLDHPEDEIRDYIVDLGDTLGDEIRLVKDYQRGGWNISFHISRDSDRFDAVKEDVDEQIVQLDRLLGSVNLKLVDLEEKKDVNRKITTGQKAYGQYNLLIRKK